MKNNESLRLVLNNIENQLNLKLNKQDIHLILKYLKQLNDLIFNPTLIVDPIFLPILVEVVSRCVNLVKDCTKDAEWYYHWNVNWVSQDYLERILVLQSLNIDKSVLKTSLKEFFNYLSSTTQKEGVEQINKITIKIFKSSSEVVKDVFKDFFDSKLILSLIEQNHVPLIKKSIELLDNNKIDIETFNYCLANLDTKHSVFQNACSKYIGQSYSFRDELIDHQLPDFNSTAKLILEKHISGHHVAGGFLNGILDCEPLNRFYEVLNMAKEDFNLSDWLEKIATQSSDKDPDVPGTTPFWFYIHEYYDSDPNFVMKLIQNKKYWLAMMCATEHQDSFDIMRPCLEILKNCEDLDISSHTEWYLKKIQGEA